MKELNEVLVKRNSSPVVLQAAAPRSDKGLKSATLKPDSSPQTEKKVNSDLHEKESKGSKVKEGKKTTLSDRIFLDLLIVMFQYFHN